MTRNVCEGMSGPDVLRYQEMLNLCYLKVGRIKADGIFGPKTKCATVEFQKKYGLSVDGIIGPNTGTFLIRHHESADNGLRLVAARQAWRLEAIKRDFSGNLV